MQVVNYQKVLDDTLSHISNSGNFPSLLLHSCCAPCSSYVLEYLSSYFHITVFYYNPNIYPSEEYYKRIAEQKWLIDVLNAEQISNRLKINITEGNYDTEKYYDAIRGFENLREGGERCFKCYELRLREAASFAVKNHFVYFTTTLTLSPLKNSAKINEIGSKIAEEYGINYLFSDFKKREGYKRSIVLSHRYNLYRQNYCGCKFSQAVKAK